LNKVYECDIEWINETVYKKQGLALKEGVDLKESSVGNSYRSRCIRETSEMAKKCEKMAGKGCFSCCFIV